MKKLLISLLLVSSAALAHEDASWIEQEPSFKRKDAPWVHCCSPKDCAVRSTDLFEKIPRVGVREKSSGRIFKFNEPGLYPSINNEWWSCTNSLGEVQCIFFPQAEGV